MTSDHNFIADAAIISMLKKGDPSGWEQLYDKYSSVVYGSILKITPVKKVAAQILIQSFAALPTTDILIQNKKTLMIFLLHHTYAITIKYLALRNLNPAVFKSTAPQFPLIDLLLFTPLPAKIIAQKARIAETELRSTLKSESQRLKMVK